MENADHLQDLSHNIHSLVITALLNLTAPTLSWNGSHGPDFAEISKHLFPFLSPGRPGFCLT